MTEPSDNRPEDAVEGGEGELRRRRVRKRKARTRPAGFIAFLHGRSLGRAIFAVMAVVALVHLGRACLAVQGQGEGYGHFALGLGRHEVLYRFGKPVRVEGNGDVVDYLEDGTRYTLRFDGQGRVAAVRCSLMQAEGQLCVDTFDVRPGNTEADVLEAIGKPDTTVWAGDQKRFRYEALGLTAILQRERLVSVEVDRPAGFLARLRLAVWRCLP